MNKIRQYKKTAALLLGMLSALAFAPLYAVPVLVLSLSLVWMLADRAENRKQAAVIGYWYGFGMFAAGFYWVGNALLIDAESFGWLYPLALAGAGAFFGLFAVPAFVGRFMCRKPWSKILVFGALWVVAEWLRSFILTGFPWNLLGTVWAFDPLFIQTAALWGTYGLSFVTILLSGGIYLLMNGKWKSGLALTIGVVVALVVFGQWRLSKADAQSSDIVVRLVQPAIPQQMKWNRDVLEDNLNRYVELSRADGWENVDFVIWGETAAPFYLDPEEVNWRTAVRAVPPQGYLITGSLRFDGYQTYNSLFVLNEEFKLIDYYDKNHLVPFGEYIPLRDYLPDWVRPVANQIADFGTGEPFKTIKLENLPPFGALICYEIIFPDEVINRKNKPSWLVLLSNDGWYGHSAGPYQHLAAARMRAVEEGLTIVRSANTGISAVITPFGTMSGVIGLDQKGYADVRLPQQMSVDTAYSHIGGFVLNIFIIVILIFSYITFTLINRMVVKK